MINSHALPKGPKKSSEILGPMSFEDLQVELEKDVIEGAGETVQVRLSMIDEIRDMIKHYMEDHKKAVIVVGVLLVIALII